MKAEDLAVYSAVCNAVGSELASIELDKVILVGDSCCLIADEIDISGAFLWECTPQGHNFWADICFEDRE